MSTQVTATFVGGMLKPDQDLPLPFSLTFVAVCVYSLASPSWARRRTPPAANKDSQLANFDQLMPMG